MYETRVSHGKGSAFTAANMNIGDLGKICFSRKHPYGGHIALRTYDGLVSLTDPECTWRDSHVLKELHVELLPPGAEVTLTVVV